MRILIITIIMNFAVNSYARECICSANCLVVAEITCSVGARDLVSDVPLETKGTSLIKVWKDLQDSCTKGILAQSNSYQPYHPYENKSATCVPWPLVRANANTSCICDDI